MKTVLSIILSAALFSFSACAKKEALPAVVGNNAPAFTLKDTGGRTVRLSDFSGKVVVIDFWATWCGPCKESTVELEKLHRKYRDRGVVVLGISMDEGGEAVRKVKGFAEKNNLTYPMLMDDGKTSGSYGVYTIPVTFVLDRKHVIVAIYKGYMPRPGDRIAGQIEKLL